MTPITIRAATADDLPFLWEMLYESAFVDEGTRAAWRARPSPPDELVKYLDGWRRTGDTGVVAIDGSGDAIGAAWYRLFTPEERGDGVLAPPGVPEIAIALAPAHRGRGIGGLLMEALMRAARDAGYERLILSVDPANSAALRLYWRLGFAVVETDDAAAGTSLIMKVDL